MHNKQCYILGKLLIQPVLKILIIKEYHLFWMYEETGPDLSSTPFHTDRDNQK